MTHLSQLVRGLYGITPQTTDFPALAKKIEQAAAGGLRVLQWRQKTLAPADALQHAHSLAKLCRLLGVTFIVNDDVGLARAVQADGVHLGKDDGNIGAARAALGADKIIGRSCYNELARAKAALQDGADYVAFGAVFASSVKPDAPHAPLELFEQARQQCARLATKPFALVAIGGITLANAPLVLGAGADSLAVIGGLFDTPDIHSTAAQFAALF